MIIPISIVVPYRLDSNGGSAWTQVRETVDSFHKLLEFPGGKVGQNEGPVDAAIREVLEETGVALEGKDIVKFKNYHFELGENKIMLMVFLFEDTKQVFNGTGWSTFSYLADNPDMLPAKNIEIINDLVQWFQ
jgi:8-oxo-dGTP pyrophosphatase MutT (NUDIX family)